MSRTGTTLEEFLAGKDAPAVEVDLNESTVYTQEELYDALLAVKCKFAVWADCELHAIRYAGDETNTAENVSWLNSLNEGTEYVQAAEFLMDFHSPADPGPSAWEPDTEYTDYQWWLARSEGGGWEIVTGGY